MTSFSGMTGFARIDGNTDDIVWAWEARSVNGKGLDIRLRVPSDLTALDAPIRKAFVAYFNRGNIQLSLSLASQSATSAHTIDEGLLDALAAIAEKRGEPLRLDQMLLVPGVVVPRVGDRPKEVQDALEAAILASVDDIALKLKVSRDTEGTALKPLLLSAIEKIEVLTSQAEKIAAEHAKTLQGSLQAKLTELLGQNFPEERLVQEASLLALKTDVREELDRLKAHCDQARDLLSKGSPVGRKLDFLCQEFNRETNTLCAKSADIDLTRIGLELKSVVEQFREQAANVE
ncbi:MAG: YicC/YloC family endoribonuclease [Alphaproteobacteria bacterium]